MEHTTHLFHSWIYSGDKNKLLQIFLEFMVVGQFAFVKLYKNKTGSIVNLL